MKKIKVRIVEESISSFYKAVAKELGKDPENYVFDCTQIQVSEDRYTAMENWDLANHDNSREGFAMRWVCYGPKTLSTLCEEEVLVDDHFLLPRDENLRDYR